MRAQHTAVQLFPLAVGTGAIALNVYLSQMLLPGVTFLLALAFLILLLLNIWENARNRSAWLVRFAFTFEAGGLFIYSFWHLGSVAHWLFEEGTMSHIFIFLGAAVATPFLISLLLEGALPHRDVNPG